jgi:tetratricopeptide (TPR) repeat protein
MVRLGRADTALQHLKIALPLREAVSRESPINAGARGEVADVYAAMGEALTTRSRHAEALGWYRRAADLYADLDHKKQLNASTQELYEAVKREVARLQR